MPTADLNAEARCSAAGPVAPGARLAQRAAVGGAALRDCVARGARPQRRSRAHHAHAAAEVRRRRPVAPEKWPPDPSRVRLGPQGPAVAPTELWDRAQGMCCSPLRNAVLDRCCHRRRSLRALLCGLQVLPGGECVVHFGLENATLRVQASEIMVLWERWTGTTPTLKWVPVVEHGLTRPASAPTHRSRHHYQHPAVGQDENEGPMQVLLMRPSSARPATTATRHRQRVPAPGGRTMNQVSHLVHKPENQVVLNVARQSVKYADVERLTRLALPVAEQREHNEREASR